MKTSFLYMYRGGMERMVWAAVVVLLIIIISLQYVNFHPERFVSLNDASLESVAAAGMDDLDLNEYGNISLSGDIDTTRQRVFYHGNNDSEFENSDLIEQSVLGGSDIFQPASGFQGVSAASHAGLNAFTMAGPSGLPYFDDMSMYDTPLSGSYDMDELLARKQQHRGAINQKATEGRVRSTKNLYAKYFQNELDENSNRIWWDDSGSEESGN